MAPPEKEPDESDNAPGTAAASGTRDSTAHEPAVHEPSAREDGELNRSLEDVLTLLDQEVQRLQASLEYYRLKAAPDAADEEPATSKQESAAAQYQALIRWHVQQIDLRHDRMAEIKQMILADRGDVEH